MCTQHSHVARKMRASTVLKGHTCCSHFQKSLLRRLPAACERMSVNCLCPCRLIQNNIQNNTISPTTPISPCIPQLRSCCQWRVFAAGHVLPQWSRCAGCINLTRVRTRPSKPPTWPFHRRLPNMLLNLAPLLRSRQLGHQAKLRIWQPRWLDF